jgi:hypothetical protein
MIFNAELAQDGFKETTPLAVIGIIELKKNGDMRTNVHSLNGGG